MDITARQITLVQCYDHLLAALSDVGACIRKDHQRALWVSLSEQELDKQQDMRLKAIGLFHQIWYLDEQEGRETINCPGLIGASPETIDSAVTCNQAKDDFKQSVLALKQLSKKKVDLFLSDLQTREENVALTLRRMGTSRINLKQAYRHIPLLHIKPVKVGFTWSKQSRTIQRISVADARRILGKRQQTPLVSSALSRLASLPDSEILARARSVVPHLRANIVFDPSEVTPHRRLMQTPLPLLIPLQPGESLPEYIPIPPEPYGHARLRRSDVKIEDEPFIPLLNVYRYRQSHI